MNAKAEETWTSRPSIAHEGQWEVYRRVKDEPEQQYLVRFHYMADELADYLNALQQQLADAEAKVLEERKGRHEFEDRWIKEERRRNYEEIYREAHYRGEGACVVADDPDSEPCWGCMLRGAEQQLADLKAEMEKRAPLTRCPLCHVEPSEWVESDEPGALPICEACALDVSGPVFASPRTLADLKARRETDKLQWWDAVDSWKARALQVESERDRYREKADLLDDIVISGHLPPSSDVYDDYDRIISPSPIAPEEAQT